MKKNKRFTSLEGHKGIRLDSITKKYVVRKNVDGESFQKTFRKLSEAIHWHRNFHPLLADSEINVGISTMKNNIDEFEHITGRLNGVDKRFTFAQVWSFYRANHLAALEPQTVEERLKFARHFLANLMHYKMVEITPELLDAFMKKKVEEALIIKNPRRKNFDNDLKFLKALLNWYRENYDISFANPVLKRHRIVGRIQQIYKSKHKMSLNDFHSFINSFDELFWRDFAELHFYMASRVQEIGGLQKESVDLQSRTIYVTDVAIWANTKKFSRLKEIPKNGEERTVHINDRMSEILNRRMNDLSPNCGFYRESTGERLSFVFHQNGHPVSYRSIQYRYDKALKKAGLYPKFRATHILRKAMANVVRKEMGLDAAQAAGGWKSRDVVEKTYTNAPTELNKVAVNHVEKLFSKIEGKAEEAEFKPKLSIVRS